MEKGKLEVVVREQLGWKLMNDERCEVSGSEGQPVLKFDLAPIDESRIGPEDVTIDVLQCTLDQNVLPDELPCQWLLKLGETQTREYSHETEICVQR
jgi:hypothetical protein